MVHEAINKHLYTVYICPPQSLTHLQPFHYYWCLSVSQLPILPLQIESQSKQIALSFTCGICLIKVNNLSTINLQR